MIWIAFGAGIFIGVFIGFLATGLCCIASREEAEDL